MNFLVLLPIEVHLAVLALLGSVAGSQINRGIYRLAWNRRAIGPWSMPHDKAPPRGWFDRIPVFGWLSLRRETALHGQGFWLRPMLIELAAAVGLPLLYWWELNGGLLPNLVGLVVPPDEFLTRYLSHVILLALLVIATFIDFDEKTIPDAVTVPGTIAALLFAAVFPLSRLPVVVEVRGLPPMNKPLLLTSPFGWPPWLDGIWGLAIGVGCFTAWCLAILPRFWTLRRGLRKAVQFFFARIFRESTWWQVSVMAVLGCTVIAAVWRGGGDSWKGLLTALVGLAFGGGLIWAVRIVGGGALGREAMGFGDVMLMSMIGAYVGWQPSLMIFFMAPFAAVMIAVGQWLMTRRTLIAFGPYLCLATLLLIVNWGRLWYGWADGIFALGWWIPKLVGVCLILMAGMLLAMRLARSGLTES